jgi:hypothetical protein
MDNVSGLFAITGAAFEIIRLKNENKDQQGKCNVHMSFKLSLKTLINLISLFQNSS